MAEKAGGFPGDRNTRLVLAILVFAVLIVRFGFLPGSRNVETISEWLISVTSVLYLAGILLPPGKRSIRDKYSDEKWLFLFSFLYLASLVLILAWSRANGRGAAAFEGPFMVVTTLYTIFCSARIFLARFGSWAVGTLAPWAVLPVSFAIVIAFGTFMLMLPASTPEGGLNLVDSAFTSTSATCVTGLIVRNTATEFTLFGQVVILILIQVGGLGIMTFAAFFALFLGHSAGLRESASLTRLMDSDFINDLKKMMGSIIGWTLTIETVGAFVLYLIWNGQPVNWSTRMKIWQSVFHSVSAFCNAGFSLNPAPVNSSAGFFSSPENLEGFAHTPGIPLTIGILIVLGGIGFMVLTTLGTHMLHRLRTGTRMRMSVQVKLVLLITGILIIAGMAAFLAAEWNGSLAGMSPGQKLANSFLGSVTPRTAGFNTVPTRILAPSLLWFYVILMFIGASPGGTGGGIKTSTLGVLWMTTISLLRHKPATEIWKRRISVHDIKRTAAVFLLASITFCLSAGMLLVSESGGSGFGPFDYIFEAMSAFGTVGLSTGVTPHLTWTGKVIIILTMFAGRIGPAALAAATGGRYVMHYKYPETRITMG